MEHSLTEEVIMERARSAGYGFNDSDEWGVAVEKVCDQLGIAHQDSDPIFDKILEIQDKLNELGG